MNEWKRPSFSILISPRFFFWSWLPLVSIGLLHYASPPDAHWIHDILRRVYYLPILLGAFSGGLRGGLAVSLAVSLTYAPHAFLHGMNVFGHDPADNLEKFLEIILFFVVGIVAGILVDREKKRAHFLNEALSREQSIRAELVRAGRLSALGEMVMGLTHEIKNPLHSLKGTAEVVDPLISKAAKERPMWELHRGELNRLERITDRFLAFARPGSLRLVHIEAHLFLKRIRELAKVQAEEAHSVVKMIEKTKDLYFWGDMDQLTQALLNMTLNALQATPPNEEVTLGVTKDLSAGEERLGLWVENKGSHIPVSDMEKIFDPFFTTRAEGTGLGLAVSQRIAQSHGGSILGENIQGGVCFTLWVPLKDPLHHD